MSVDVENVSVLEKLEERIVDMVEQLKQSRRKQAAAEKEAAELREELAGKERELDELRSSQSDAEGDREAVRRRIEGLLDRIDSMD